MKKRIKIEIWKKCINYGWNNYKEMRIYKNMNKRFICRLMKQLSLI